MLQDLVIYQKVYDLLLYLYPIINKFPKSQRFVLGQHIENKALDLLQLLIRAQAVRDKSKPLQDISIVLDELRTLVRLAKDLLFMQLKQYERTAEKLNEISKLLQGLIRRFIPGYTNYASQK
jgi:four helix bundle protein